MDTGRDVSDRYWDTGEVKCNHFMVWTCLGGYSIYRCSKCDYFDGKKTFADKEQELAELKKLVREITALIENDVNECFKYLPATSCSSDIIRRTENLYRKCEQACTLANDSKEED